jgi:hypothetical protein
LTGVGAAAAGAVIIIGAGEALQPLVQPDDITVEPQPDAQATGALQLGAGAAQLLQAGAAQQRGARWQRTRACLQQ